MPKTAPPAAAPITHRACRRLSLNLPTAASSRCGSGRERPVRLPELTPQLPQREVHPLLQRARIALPGVSVSAGRCSSPSSRPSTPLEPLRQRRQARRVVDRLRGPAALQHPPQLRHLLAQRLERRRRIPRLPAARRSPAETLPAPKRQAADQRLLGVVAESPRKRTLSAASTAQRPQADLRRVSEGWKAGVGLDG